MVPQRGFQVMAGLCMALLLEGIAAPAPGQEPDALPKAEAVTRRLLERARQVTAEGFHPIYTYQSRSRLDELGPKGQVLDTEEKLYHVEWIAGLPVKRLVEVKGRNLSPEELEQEQRNEERFREKFTSMNTRHMAARRESVLTKELLERYRFVVKERVLLDGRPTLVVTFAAKPGPDEGTTLQDMILNRLAGTLWVDEEDADPARVRITLVEPLSLGWFAILGSLTRCDFDLQRRRMPEGLWINEVHSLHIHCRKLTHTMRYRKTERASHFQKIEASRLSLMSEPPPAN